MRKITVLDTTLRDGEQVPGAKLNTVEKLEIAVQLSKLGVDIIEAGFPASSAGDFHSVETIARKVGQQTMVTALARAVQADIDAVYNSIKLASSPLIHIVLGTSDIHVAKKFSRSREQVLEQGVSAVKYAKSLMSNVQYSTEDASRSDFEYLWDTISAVVKAGATMINIPDTVGYAEPEEFGELVRKINERLKNVNPHVLLSVHCHNDLGLATANTLAGIKNGADKIECTINGIGERAGNAALEEVVMGLRVREAFYGVTTNIVTSEIYNASRLVSSLMGLEVQVNKAITGENAFAHSSGIHQDGLLKSREVYEILRPEDVGVKDMNIVLTARSGRHAVKDALAKLGFSDLEEEPFERVFKQFLELADSKKEVFHHDLYLIMDKFRTEEDTTYRFAQQNIQLYELLDLQVVSNRILPSASVKIGRGTEIFTSSCVGDGVIDAMYSAIRDCIGIDIELVEFKVQSISRGKEAVGKVRIRVMHNGVMYTAKAADTDILVASATALLNVVNQIVLAQSGSASADEKMKVLE